MRFQTSKCSFLVLFCWAAFPTTTSAHHSVASTFDTAQIEEIEGELIDVRWQNPHVSFAVRVMGAEGQAELWDIETNSVSIMSRMDLSGDVFTLGDRVRVAGNPARAGGTMLYARNMQLQGMEEVLLAPGVGPRWSDVTLGTSERWRSEGSDSNDDNGIFRVWSTSFTVPMLIPRFAGNNYPLTRGAQRTAESFDPANSPLLACNPKGMPTIMEQPYPMEFIDTGDTITLRLEEYDTVRTFDMTGQAIPANPASTLLGHSTGRWDQDTLVVTTTNANWPHVDAVGIPLSQLAEMVETFWLNQETSRLEYTLTITDPSVFTEPLELEKEWVWVPENTVEPYNCTVSN
jgi:hypothetical protein